jgi:RNA polymerase sigma-70 factor (ECF subfamily)
MRPALNSKLTSRLYRQSRAERWGLAVHLFRAALDASVAHAFGDRRADASEVERHAASLHLEDLALACACAAGLESAWDHFVSEYRAALYRAADAIDPAGGARDLADSLYADLFGLQQRHGIRQSLFRYFHGRSSLATWLRAVLSQRYIDRLRERRRLEALPDESTTAGAVTTVSPDAEHDRFADAMRGALTAAVASLSPRDRLRLSCYYAQDLTLAAIGRLLGEHEATVSRHLARTRRDIRQEVERRLRADYGLDEPAIAECFAAVVDDPGSMDVATIIGAGLQE